MKFMKKISLLLVCLLSALLIFGMIGCGNAEKEEPEVVNNEEPIEEAAPEETEEDEKIDELLSLPDMDISIDRFDFDFKEEDMGEDITEYRWEDEVNNVEYTVLARGNEDALKKIWVLAILRDAGPRQLDEGLSFYEDFMNECFPEIDRGDVWVLSALKDSLESEVGEEQIKSFSFDDQYFWFEVKWNPLHFMDPPTDIIELTVSSAE